jgi:hypothetical protein
MFFRRYGDFSFGTLTVFLSILSLLHVRLLNFRHSVISINLIILLVIIEVAAMSSLKYSLSIDYLKESSANLLIFLAIVTSIKKRRDFDVLVVLASLVAGFLGLYLFLQNPISTFRRLALGGGLNYLAVNYAIATVLSLNLFFENRKQFYLISTIVLTLLTVAQGSRQAIFGLLVAIILLFSWNGYRVKRFIFLWILIIPASLGIFGWVFSEMNITLFNRFNWNFVQDSLEVRLALWTRGFTDNVTVYSFFQGSPEYTTLFTYSTPNHLYNPHNVLAYLFRYSGVFSVIAFCVLVVLSFKRVVYKVDYLIFGQILVYLLFSGELSRTFSFFIILGLLHVSLHYNLRLKSN